MANLKATIDYKTILFKAQLNIAIVSASETHSKRPTCIKFFKGTILY